MSNPSRPSVPARLLAALLLPLLLVSLVWLSAGRSALAQKKEEEEEQTPAKAVKPRPKPEEEEDTTPRPKRKVERPEEEDKAAPRKPVKTDFADTPDLVTAARQAKNPQVREFLDSVAEPHDVIVNPRVVKRVAPLDQYLGNPPRFTGTIEVHPFLDEEWVQDKKSWPITSGSVTGITYYEQIALKRVEEFLEQPLDRDPKKKNYVSRADMLRLAETVLSSVLNWHESAQQQGKRQGDAFDEMEANLKKKLFDVRLDELNLRLSANDWDGAFTLALHMADTYAQPKEREKIAQALATVISRAAQAGTTNDQQLLEVQDRLRQLEERFPNSAAFAPINNQLKQQAQGLFDRAKDLVDKDKGRRREALDLLRRAEKIYPRLPGLHDYRLKLDNALGVLRVGVRDLPVNLSPSLACTDPEKQAVELLFDSLVKVSYDPDMGQYYTTGLADGRPRLIPLGRSFEIDRSAYWSNEKPVTGLDVRHTVRLLKDPSWSGYNPAWAELLDDPQVGSDPSHVSVTLKQGFLDPLSLMTFKVLPAEPWPDHSPLSPKDEVRFAQSPVGSGPYQLGTRGALREGNPYVSFVASPNYTGRAGKADLLRIREVQFIQSADPVEDFRKGRLDLVTDLPSDKVKAAQGLGRDVVVLPPQPNRRIYFLAVNSRRHSLQNQDLRKALAHAIDREKILDEVFRADLGKNVHRALDGPYPPGSWAHGPQQRYSVDVAKSRMDKAREAGLVNPKLTLKYPNDDPRLEKAMQAIHDQVAAQLGVELELVARPPRALRDEVEGAHDYDLAYYHYDYPSDAFWLWPLFDPRAVDTKGSNYLGYTNDSGLEKQFGETMAHRDFPQVQKATQVLGELIFDRMPLIPLWQLDTHVVMSKDLRTTPFDPFLVFSDIDQWRLEKK